jgi:integrase
VALTDKRVKAAPPGRHYDGRGLLLKVRETGSKDWCLRITKDGKTTDYGLGGWPDVSLEDARNAAFALRRTIKAGGTPARRAKAERFTFEQRMEQFIGARRSGWRSPKSEAQFKSSMAAYTLPKFGKKTAKDVTREDVLAVLRPIWLTKTETADRVRMRIEQVLDYAAVVEQEPDRPNVAKLKPYLITLLPTRPKTADKHFAAMPYKDLPGFWTELADMTGGGAAALRWTILTAARSGETRGAAWAEIEDGWWRIPAQRMKAHQPHDVPLCEITRRFLPERVKDKTLLFQAPRGGALSDMTISAVLKRMGRGEFTVHGFRSTFRDWVAAETSHSPQVAEMCLAHRLKDKVEAAYLRTRMDEKRAALLSDWAAFVTGGVGDA